MRGRARGVATATAGLALAIGLLAGCTLPEGVDGDLTSGWAELPEPTGFVPEAGVCHDDDYRESATLANYRPVSCDESHMVETVHVGEFSGPADDRVTPPPTGSSEWRSAYRECDEAAASYLGANFRYARLWLGVTVPSADAWEGGSRWFRCEVMEFSAIALSAPIRSGSLAGALSGDSRLLLGCFAVTLDDDRLIDEMDAVDCDEPHQAEFVGVWEASGNRYLASTNQDEADQVYQGCREQVAEYVDLPVDDDLVFRTGSIVDWMTEEDWDNGDRQFRCYLWVHDQEIEGSLKGAGTDAMPIR